jgi:hypothetical protein
LGIELRALDYSATGKPAKAARLFALSDQLTRRSLPTRLWLIQQSVDRGDVAGALTNFDIALRTSNEAPLLLFPVLARASTDPTLARPLASTLDRPSEWRLMFFEWALSNSKDLHGLANVAIAMRDRRFVTGNRIDQRLIEQLVTADDFGQALRLKQRFGQRSAGLLADPHFDDPRALYPFGWGLVSEGSLGAERGLADGRPMLTYRATSSRTGQVAAQLLMLAPGRYALATRSAASVVGEAPMWAISCGQEGGSQLVRLEQPMAAGQSAGAGFVVPPGCPAQWLTLSVRPAAESQPQSGATASVTIVRR